ncbi:MAG: UDP-N-acetylmuramate dehydrogenase [Patescibacteria group bacterium]|nr:UDP-N-acetylmuramate dehydrogenase [Patescibacteria group bacterium]
MIDLKSLLPEIKENEALAPYTTFKIGGPAKYFLEAKNNVELVKALQVVASTGLNYIVIGGGSNLLVSDSGFDGLVIRQLNNQFKIDGDKVMTESGAKVADVLAATLTAGLIGWAWAAGLPGLIGGAIRGNAGAYGEAMSNITESVEVFRAGKTEILTNEQLKFSYRHSLVKDEKMVILAATLKLKKGDPTVDEELVKKYLDHREKTQPLDLPNPGCAFKNINLQEVQIDQAKVIKALDITEAEWQAATKYNKLSVSFIFDKMNWKGKTIGGAKVSEKHGAFIVNAGEAKAEHVIMLMSELKMRVRNELGLALEEEIQLVGF